MRIGLLALLLLVVASVTNAAIYETVYEDVEAESKSTITFTIDNQPFVNSGSLYWKSYTFEIISGGEFIAGSASSDFFDVVNPVYDNGLLTAFEFSLSNQNPTVAELVQPGQTVLFSYEIAVDTDNLLFGVQLERTPEEVVPEPATIALSVMGAGMLLRRKF